MIGPWQMEKKTSAKRTEAIRQKVKDVIMPETTVSGMRIRTC